MFKRTHLQAIVMLALGGLLGYATATGQFTSLLQATVAHPTTGLTLAPRPGLSRDVARTAPPGG
jgi:hypothetical protein